MLYHVAPYGYLLPTVYMSVAGIANPNLLACSCRTWISLYIARFYEEQWQSFSGSAWPKNGTGEVDTICTSLFVMCPTLPMFQGSYLPGAQTR